MHQSKKTGIDCVQSGEQGDGCPVGVGKRSQGRQDGAEDDLGDHQSPPNAGKNVILVVVLRLLHDGVTIQSVGKSFGRPVPAGWMDNDVAIADILESSDAAGHSLPLGWA